MTGPVQNIEVLVDEAVVERMAEAERGTDLLDQDEDRRRVSGPELDVWDAEPVGENLGDTSR